MTTTIITRWIYDDGGRAEAGFKGATGDCVVRALTIATQEDYQTVYDELFDLSRKLEGRDAASPRLGVSRKVYDVWLAGRGWVWVPTMKIGEGCTVHLRADELPPGRLIVRLSRHLSAVIDGTVRDTFDPARGGTRCVYGYWKEG